MTALILADFVAIAMSICHSNLTRSCVMDGRADIPDVGNATQPIQSCCTKRKRTTLIQRTANVSIALKNLRNDCISIIVIIQTNLGPGHVRHAT